MGRVRITHIQAEAPSLNKKQRKAWKKRIKRSISSAHLSNIRQQLWHKNSRQARRWLAHQVHRADRGGISPAVEQQLVERFLARDKKEQDTPKLKEGKRGELLPEAESVWARLRAARSAAMEAAGASGYVEDWWVGQEVQGGEEDIGGLEVEMEELDIAGGEESEEGGVPVGDRGDEHKDEDENYEGFWGVETVLAFRERRQ